MLLLFYEWMKGTIMIYYDGRKIEFSLEDDDSDLTFVGNSYGRLELLTHNESTYQVILSLTKDAMLCLGVHLVYMAANDQWGCMRNNPVGDDEAISMGVRPSPLSGSLFFEQTEAETSCETILAANQCKICTGKTFSINLDKDIEAQYEDLFTNTAEIEIYEQLTGNRVYGDTLFRLNREGMLGLGITLIRISHNFQKGKGFSFCHSVKALQEHADGFPGLLLTEDSATMKICCAELPDRNQYKVMIKEMRERNLSKADVAKLIQKILDEQITRENAAIWANWYVYVDNWDRCRLIDRELKHLAVVDHKNENGEYVFTNEMLKEYLVKLTELTKR